MQGPAWPALIVMGLVLTENPRQMGLVPDEGAVQELAAASELVADAIASDSGLEQQPNGQWR